MKKRIFLIAPIVLFSFACNTTKNTSTSEKKKVETESKTIPVKPIRSNSYNEVK